MMKQNTTPIITVEIPDCGDSLTTAQSVYLTVSNGKASYDILAEAANINDDTVSFMLTTEQTRELVGKCEAEVTIISTADAVMKTDTLVFYIDKSVKEGAL